MTVLQAVILGIIQGATEFIPVSSSGHLVLAPFYLNWQIPPEEAFVFDVLVQVATLAAVIAYFRRDLRNIISAMAAGIGQGQPFSDARARLGWLLILATIPAGGAALVIKDQLEQAFNSPPTAAVFLIVTGLMLAAAELLPGKKTRDMNSLQWTDALMIGFFQALALFPGISRSGSTITGGMFRRLSRKEAAGFSFLMSVPVMFAAMTLGVYDLFQIDQAAARLPAFLSGFLSAAVVGYFSIRWLLSFLRDRSLLFFSVYCLLAGALSLALLYI